MYRKNKKRAPLLLSNILVFCGFKVLILNQNQWSFEISVFMYSWEYQNLWY